MKDLIGTIMLAANNDIVELMIRDRLYWATRKQYLELAETTNILEAIVAAGGGLSAIQHILDDATSMDDIRARLIQWQAIHHTVVSIEVARAKKIHKLD